MGFEPTHAFTRLTVFETVPFSLTWVILHQDLRPQSSSNSNRKRQLLTPNSFTKSLSIRQYVKHQVPTRFKTDLSSR